MKRTESTTKELFEATGFSYSPYQNSFTFVRNFIGPTCEGKSGLVIDPISPQNA
jgi:hypothetical protein